ncbi:zeta toxin family protein, partial [Acinetobacter calcoaceticus]
MIEVDLKRGRLLSVQKEVEKKERLMTSQKKAPIIIGVTGGSGSGKTTVSQAIAQKFANHSVMLLP